MGNASMPDSHVELAKATIRAFVSRGEAPEPPPGLPEELARRRAGVFVSVKKRGELRGCIGTIGPTCANVAEEIVQNAVSACSRDPRFPPVAEDELDGLTVSVDVLGVPEPVGSLGELDPARYGVIVSKGYRRGLLLPNLDGVDTVERQLAIALDKAGLRGVGGYAVEKFEVVRHERGGDMGGAAGGGGNGRSVGIGDGGADRSVGSGAGGDGGGGDA